MNKKNKKILALLISLSILFSILFLTIWIFTQRELIGGSYNSNMNYVYFRIIKRRSTQLLAIFISTILITTSSLVFQTLTKNRILTPSVLGFDSIFVVTQTLIVALLGTASFLISNIYFNFLVSTIFMVFITLGMYFLILRKNKNNIILLLLMGMILSSLASSISNFVQVFMNPDEFQSVLALTTVSLSNINEKLVYVTLPMMIILVILFYRKHHIYDVMSLGEDQAISLGVDYNKESKISLIYIAVAISISTALIGPLAFLGLIAVNSARELFKSSKHKSLIVISSLIGFIILMSGQVLVELFDNRTSVAVLINLIGGVYMIYLILKENKLWLK